MENAAIDSSSAVFELVGLKELAEYDPDTYYEHIQTLLDRARSSAGKLLPLPGQSHGDELIIKSALDKLFVCAPSPEILLGFACLLRQGLVFENKQLFLRGILGKGDCFSEVSMQGGEDEGSQENGLGSTEAENAAEGEAKINADIFDLGISSLGVSLHGELESLKGVGLKCRDDLGGADVIDAMLRSAGLLLEESPASDHEATEPLYHLRTIVNFFVSSMRPDRFTPFHDISLGRPINDRPEYLRQVIAALREGRLRGQKVARLYVPFLVNWARTVDLSRANPVKRRKARVPQLDRTMMEPGFCELMRDLPGLYLVALTFLDRVFKPKADNIDGERKVALKSFFLDNRRKWLHRLVRIDTEPSIPSGVLSDSSRRKFSEELAKKGS